MIPSKYYKPPKIQAPLLNLLTDGPYMDKLLIKTIYPQWTGETVEEIMQKSSNNPFVLRIGTPGMDRQIESDQVYFIPKYISYNPLAKQIEYRNLTNHRFTRKVYIGEQTPDETAFGDYSLFVNGNIVGKDLILSNTNESVAERLRSLEMQVKYLQTEIAKIAKQTVTQTIYK